MSYQSHRLQPNHKPIDNLYTDRLRTFIDGGGQFHDLNLPKLYQIDRKLLNLQSYRVPDGKNGETLRPLFKEIDWENVSWENIGLGYAFGPSWKSFWVKFDIEIPQDWLKYEQIEIEWDSSTEAMIYDHKGLPLHSFTGGGERNLFKIPQPYLSSKKQQFFIEVACNGMFGNGGDGHPDPNRYFPLNKAYLVLPNMEARRLFWDFWILSDGAREFPGGSWQKYQALHVCNEIMNQFDPQDPTTIGKCRKLAQKLLGDKINSEDVFNDFSSPNKRIDVYGIGNCHIDTAWMWPFAETKRKVVRSWTTQLRICDQYPEYVFVASQMQQFKWLKMYHPEILDKIKEKFTTNQFIPIGGSWVENDVNIPNGESLIRQFLLGQRFQMQEFGFYSNIFWLPDTFGYSSQIPQICHLVNIDRFLTQKLSWNNINQFPLTTFNWVGLDGSQVLVHMPPANTYTASANFGDVIRSQSQHKNLGDNYAGMLLYGHGDGGGGPTEEMLEKIRRCRGLANTSGLMPTVHLGNTVDEFYEEILRTSNNGDDLPSWLGEIYLEYHRGTYTTHADIKRFNRDGEVKLHDLELIATLVSISNPKYKYPAKEIVKLWEDLCLCQFHDVLPGSCIGMVYYDEVYPMQKQLIKNANKLIDDALSYVTDSKDTSTDAVSVFNTLPWDRKDILLKASATEHPAIYNWCKSNNLHEYSIDEDNFAVSVNVSGGETSLNTMDEIVYPASVKANDDGTFVLSNDLLKVSISKSGIITSLYDIVNDREVIDTTSTKQTASPDGVIGGNQFLLVDDEPLNYPAWDVEIYSLDKFKFISGGKVSILTNNKLESSVVVKHKISSESSMETVISIQGLTANTDLAQNNFVKFKCHVDWHETYKFLRVQFPTTIYTANHANFETQFGITQRPTHFNTNWDIAKFEVCHHKFMDLSEYNYGVSIINSNKYGGNIHGNLMRLSLLRSAKAPDDKADMGEHNFEYALYPHKGALGPDTVQLAHNFNYRIEKVIPDPSKRLSKLLQAVTLSGDSSLILSHIKRGENDHDVNIYDRFKTDSPQTSIVLRVYESLGGGAKGVLKFDTEVLNISKAFKTNALEDEHSEYGEELTIKDHKLNIKLKGFEVATYKFYLKV